MNLPSNVFREAWWMNPYFALTKAGGTVFLNKIYFRSDVYENLTSKNPNPLYVGFLLHEEEHIKRSKKVGCLNWTLKYLLSSSFRFKEEIEADRVRFIYYKKHEFKFDFNKRAKSLSGWVYLWPVSYKTAKRELEKIWNHTGITNRYF